MGMMHRFILIYYLMTQKMSSKIRLDTFEKFSNIITDTHVRLSRDIRENWVNTKERASYVRSLREPSESGQGFPSWGRVASACHLKWGGDWTPSDNETFGMIICEVASEYLVDST